MSPRAAVGPSPLPVFHPSGLTEPATWVRAQGIEILTPSADTVVTPYMRRKREWDATLVSAVLDSLTDTSSFLDVGAMVGYVSAVVAKRIPRGRVVAVEPLPSNLEFAAANLQYFPNATVLSGAVSNETDTSWHLVVDDVNHGNNRIEPGATGQIVATATLQSLIDHYRSDVVKVDVQGIEKAVLSSLDLGSRRGKDLTIFSEITPSSWGSEDDIHAFIERFRDAGFDAYFLSDENAYSTYTRARLGRRASAGSGWSDHFEFMFTKGRYASMIRSRS
ncbi:FkbM family methyltransferase [Humibacter sp. BT305]|nr:FkbM family methyltransferase [Humibacter sp. BT305]